MTATLICISTQEIDGRRFEHGEQIPREAIKGDSLDSLLDNRRVIEVSERRSLYRLFGQFSGCAEKEELAEHEKAQLCLP